MEKDAFASFSYFAETEGFEPSEPFTARLVSSEVLSTTQPRLLNVQFSILVLMSQRKHLNLLGTL